MHGGIWCLTHAETPAGLGRGRLVYGVASYGITVRHRQSADEVRDGGITMACTGVCILAE